MIAELYDNSYAVFKVNVKDLKNNLAYLLIWKYLLSAYCVPRTVLGIDRVTVNKRQRRMYPI